VTKNGNNYSEKEKLRILAYKPGLSIQTIRLNQFIRCEPLELEYLYTILEEHHIELLDGVVDRRDPIKLAQKIKPRIVLMTSLITNISTVKKIAAKLKKLTDAPFVFVGGPHAEVMPQHFFCDNIDGVFFANQLESLQKVVKRIMANKEFHDVPGGAFRLNGTFIKNESEPLDPEKLPMAKHHLLEKYPNRYRIIYYDPCAAIKTSFGCTDNCTFCFCTEMHGGRFGMRPIKDVVDEIEQIKVKNIIVLDDNFLVSRKRLIEFCDLLEERRIEKEFIIIGGANFIARNPDLMSRLRSVGVTAAMVGFEFANDKELELYQKKANMQDNNETVRICRENDIALFALFIVDPNWKHSDFRKLARYIRSKYLPFALFSTLTVFPGTQLAKQIKQPKQDEEKWWRYDLLRLHQKPKHMSALAFYLWVFYLYLVPGMQFATIRKFHKRYGILGIIKHFFTSLTIGFEYLFKLVIWR
jgi:radical SAM superfamily enzyme YgiQ (UPF0313 family)